ncbi:ADP-ribosylation factor-like GTPAse [Chloropicon primus]|uniref:ADP-ribosylation factor-like GTPAse n=1 Tax=Chloropicon primus TaxID=1764295 RepID=A0A5B8MMW8_9CHLO|nr:ADP-ribosylation factor-like GTPAse [Chloropicon primus]UPR00608.1 ADP-ribosylation factor-like GTPAse [Chloropicon primus]|eukprot:QDZ21394.1 ADP-ribosylation factor-like GTPAse [Chloropicon primus]
MGFLSKLAALFGPGKKKVKILVVGLDNSGKSTIIQKLKPNAEKKTAVPTVGFNMEEFEKGSLCFNVFDMSGANRYRSLWEKYYNDAEAIVFVVDTADKFRMCVVKVRMAELGMSLNRGGLADKTVSLPLKDELERMLSHAALEKVPILFFANKKDVINAMTPVECAKYLELESIQTRAWQIIHSNGLTGEGLSTGIDWLAQTLQK